MRVLTRLTAVALTAGALIAPATMPAAHAASTWVVVDTGKAFVAPAGVIKTIPEEIPGQITTLTVVPRRVDGSTVSYTLRSPSGQIIEPQQGSIPGTIEFVIEGSGPTLQQPTPRIYTLRAPSIRTVAVEPEFHEATFIAL